MENKDINKAFDSLNKVGDNLKEEKSILEISKMKIGAIIVILAIGAYVTISLTTKKIPSKGIDVEQKADQNSTGGDNNNSNVINF